MTKAIQLVGHENIYIEVDSISSQDGIAKAGLSEAIKHTAEQAGAVLRETLQAAVRINVSIFQESFRDLPNKPDEIELSFGLKVSGDLGNVIITKVGAEANYGIKLSWKTQL